MHFLQDFGQKKYSFGSNTVYIGQEVQYYIVYIANYTELNWQICNYAQKQLICCENSKYAQDKSFMAIFPLGTPQSLQTCLTSAILN